MKKRLIITAITAVLCGAIFSCSNLEKGAAGPAGEEGASNTASLSFQNGVFPSNAYQGCVDALITTGYPDYNHGSCQYINVGPYDSFTLFRGLIYFDMTPVIPKDVIVVKASLDVFVIGLTGSVDMAAYAAGKYWNGGTVCGASQNGSVTWMSSAHNSALWGSPGGDYGSKKSDTVNINASAKWYSLSLDPELVESWISSPEENFGIIIKAEDEITVLNRAQFYSSDYTTDAAFRPKLTVIYRLP